MQNTKHPPDWLILPYAMDSILCLLLHSWVPPRIHQKYLNRRKKKFVIDNNTQNGSKLIPETKQDPKKF